MISKQSWLFGAGILTIALLMSACSSSNKSATSSGSSNPTAAAGSASQSSGTSASSQASGAPLKVGLICACSGPLGPSLIGAEEVYQAWVKAVNASGGINGHTIDLATYDDGGVPGTSVADAEKLISQHVDAIVDVSTLESAWASAVQQAQIPVIGVTIPDVPFYTNSDFYPEGQTTDSATYAIVATAKAAGVSNLGVVYCAEAPSCQALVSQVKADGEKLGVPVVYSASISATAPNYTAQCLAAQQQHVSALVLFDVPQPIARLGQDCSQQGYDPTYIDEGSAFSMLLANTPGISKNLWSEYNVLPFFDTSPQVTAMNTAIDKYYPGLRKNDNIYYEGSALAWPAGLLLEDGVKAGGLGTNDTPSAAEIIKGLTSLHGDTLDGWSPPLTFPANQPHPVDCWFTARIQNGTPNLVNNGQVTCEK